MASTRPCTSRLDTFRILRSSCPGRSSRPATTEYLEQSTGILDLDNRHFRVYFKSYRSKGYKLSSRVLGSVGFSNQYCTVGGGVESEGTKAALDTNREAGERDQYHSVHGHGQRIIQSTDPIVSRTVQVVG